MSKILDQDIGGTIESLRDLFERNKGELHTPEIHQAVTSIIEEANVVDTAEHEGSPWRNRPLHAVLAEKSSDETSPAQIERQAYFNRLRTEYAEKKANGTLPKKDWGVKAVRAKPGSPNPWG